MSNWSVVMIGWSGIDGKVDNHHEERFQQVTTRYAEILQRPRPDLEPGSWTAFYPCPDERSIANACEFLAVTHENHFKAKLMLDAMRDFEWEFPEEVTVMYKNEDMCSYKQEQLEIAEEC